MGMVFISIIMCMISSSIITFRLITVMSMINVSIFIIMIMVFSSILIIMIMIFISFVIYIVLISLDTLVDNAILDDGIKQLSDIPFIIDLLLNTIPAISLSICSAIVKRIFLFPYLITISFLGESIYNFKSPLLIHSAITNILIPSMFASDLSQGKAINPRRVMCEPNAHIFYTRVSYWDNASNQLATTPFVSFASQAS